jgi:hypothetical protein
MRGSPTGAAGGIGLQQPLEKRGQIVGRFGQIEGNEAGRRILLPVAEVQDGPRQPRLSKRPRHLRRRLRPAEEHDDLLGAGRVGGIGPGVGADMGTGPRQHGDELAHPSREERADQPDPAPLGPKAGGGRLARVLPQRDPEAEARSAARLGLERDLASHQGQQAARDGKAEAGAVMAPVGLILDLVELPEDVGLKLLRDADAGILHGHEQRHLPVRPDHGLHAHEDMARVGELHGVADQVEQDLPHPPAIPDQRPCAVHVEVEPEPEIAPLEPRAQEAEDLEDHGQEVERLLVQHETAGLDLGIVEEVLDEFEQRLPGMADRLGEELLLGVEPRLPQELRHGDDAVHGRAEFVAHVGEEGGLGAAGGERGVAGLPKLLLAAEGRGQVDAEADGVALRRALVDEADEAAVPEAEIRARNDLPLPAGEHPLDPVVGMRALEIDDAFFRRDPEDRLVARAGRDVRHPLEEREIGRIGGHEAAIPVEDGEPVLHRGQRVPETLLRDLRAAGGDGQLRHHARGAPHQRGVLLPLLDHLEGQRLGVFCQLAVRAVEFLRPQGEEPLRLEPGTTLLRQPRIEPAQ